MNFLALFLVAFVQGVDDAYDRDELDLCQKNLTGISGQITPTIIEGYPATMKEFPFVVRLYILKSGTLSTCTGQAVTPSLIVTAAHCVERGGNMVVVTGNADQADYIRGRNLHKYARYRVVKAYIHPAYDNRLLLHDIAFVKLSREMVHPGFSVVTPSYKKVLKPTNATICGWGATPGNKQNTQLYAKHLMVERCAYLKKHGSIYLCLMEPGICHGDSGGGLMINGLLYGIASFHDPTQERKRFSSNAYYYTSLSYESAYVKFMIRRNGSNHRPSLHTFNLVIFVFLTLFYG